MRSDDEGSSLNLLKVSNTSPFFHSSIFAVVVPVVVAVVDADAAVVAVVVFNLE